MYELVILGMPRVMYIIQLRREGHEGDECSFFPYCNELVHAIRHLLMSQSSLFIIDTFFLEYKKVFFSLSVHTLYSSFFLFQHLTISILAR